MELNKEELKQAGLPFLLMIAGAGLSVLFIVIFSELAEEILENEIIAIDEAFIKRIIQIENGTLDQIMIFVTELGSVWFLSLCTLAAVIALWVKAKDKLGILFLLIAIGGGGALTKLLKHLYGRGRPSINPEIDAIGYSFPSGHSMGSLIFYGFIAYLIVRSARKPIIKGTAIAVAGFLVIWIGFTRIYLGAHFPSDVLAGHLAGAIWLMINILALEWIKWQGDNFIKVTREFKRFINNH
ncbi:phosphatase PAP2 family protein [Mesobacillus sp.]|uniref:phosphatase PAP2 family protein n=1 Tax=Mesobacillus sp. TaxID=2675271 RepID=UPI0039EEA485